MTKPRASGSDRNREDAALIVNALEHDEQWVRLLRDPARIEELRTAIRAEARSRGMRLRTAVMPDGALAVVRVDAEVWRTDAATMRQRLSPPGGAEPF